MFNNIVIHWLNVTDMSFMFSRTVLTELDISNFDTSEVINMKCMFWETELTELDLSNFNTSQVLDMTGMFSNCDALQKLNISNFDTSRLENARGMFTNVNPDIVDVSRFIFSKDELFVE